MVMMYYVPMQVDYEEDQYHDGEGVVWTLTLAESKSFQKILNSGQTKEGLCVTPVDSTKNCTM